MPEKLEISPGIVLNNMRQILILDQWPLTYFVEKLERHSTILNRLGFTEVATSLFLREIIPFQDRLSISVGPCRSKLLL